jgi:hypothetical protein
MKMKIRLGVVGPEDSVQRILKIAGDFKDLEIMPFIYQRTGESEGIIEANRHRVDQWLFSGQGPYYYTLSRGLIDESEASYPPLYGSSLLGTLLEAIVHEGNGFPLISLDTIQQSEIDSIQKTYSLESLTITTYSYSGYEPAEDMIRFHQELFNQGKSNVALTCTQEVYLRLKELRIPCYRVVPSQLAIQQVLRYLRERGQSTLYRKSQITVLGIEVLHSSNSSEEQQYSYQMERQELDLKHVLLDYAELVRGSYVQIGDGLYYVFTTRGELNDHFNNDRSLYSLIDEVYLHSKLRIRIGLGYGFTALDAEQNVRLALQYARQHQSSVVISVNEEKVVNEFTKPGEKGITFKQRQWGEEWEEKFKDARISLTMISKIESLTRHYKKDVVTAQEISRWLKGTERNARRILSEMERLGLATVRGEEQPGSRGRPRKVYQMHF